MYLNICNQISKTIVNTCIIKHCMYLNCKRFVLFKYYVNDKHCLEIIKCPIKQ